MGRMGHTPWHALTPILGSWGVATPMFYDGSRGGSWDLYEILLYPIM